MLLRAKYTIIAGLHCFKEKRLEALDIRKSVMSFQLWVFRKVKNKLSIFKTQLHPTSDYGVNVSCTHMIVVFLCRKYACYFFIVSLDKNIIKG